MKTGSVLFCAAVLLGLLVLGVPRRADSGTGAPCDCNKKLGSCTPGAQMAGNSILITSNTEQCSQIEYEVDGIVQIARTITGGSELVRWYGVNKNPTVAARSCVICASSESGGDLVGEFSEPGNPTALDVSGAWTFHGSCDYNRSGETAQIQLAMDRAGNLSGTAAHGAIIGGRVVGTTIHISRRFKRAFFLATNILEYSGTVSASGASMSGTYTQSISPEASCTWDARRS